MKFDFHMHSNASDGSLSPAALLQLCADNGVEVAAITDHDTLAAYQSEPALPQGLQRLVPGVEISTTWNGRGIHVVGLHVDPANKTLLSGLRQQQSARLRRAETIATRLTRIGFQTCLTDIQAIAGNAVIGRPHFAQHLIAHGVKDVRTAFRKYLGAGKPGDVKTGWATLVEAIQWIQAAGGVAILAHPLKYKMTNSKLSSLLDAFTDAGGDAMEVICGSQQSTDTNRLAAICEARGMRASAGSDFHHPGNSWSSPGSFARLPTHLETVLDCE